MYGLLYECKFLTIEETNKKKKKKCLLMNRDEMSNLYRGHSKDDPYQVSFGQVVSEEKIF